MKYSQREFAYGKSKEPSPEKGEQDRDSFAKEKSHQLYSKELGARFYLYVAN